MPDTGMPTTFLFIGFSICFASAHTALPLSLPGSISGKGLPVMISVTLHVKVHFYSFHKRVLLI